ncbi:hypothetical protein [Streptomyces sp. TRM64462]|uniref:hypothetical protein n=1 Tax=Streptomyces sp. TRM64462 TaxID=2741726 RepID=UPI001586B9EB|nr:hypothetical protein [Streptomyces sp. TRM64462]
MSKRAFEELHRQVLLVLRDYIDAAHIDAHSDEPWPEGVRHLQERALRMAERQVADGRRRGKDDPGMGIDLDVRDDADFEVLAGLAPYTIHAEAWSRGRCVFSAGDTGTALCVSLTAEQEAALVARLEAVGVDGRVVSGLTRL